jgi:hypothetical protein
MPDPARHRRFIARNRSVVADRVGKQIRNTVFAIRDLVRRRKALYDGLRVLGAAGMHFYQTLSLTQA